MGSRGVFLTRGFHSTRRVRGRSWFVGCVGCVTSRVARCICRCRVLSQFFPVLYYCNCPLVERSFYVSTRMAMAWINAMVVIKEILAEMNKSGRSQGKIRM